MKLKKETKMRKEGDKDEAEKGETAATAKVSKIKPFSLKFLLYYS